jgi:hypothetical protein
LRPPGTWNHKHRPPAPVCALRLERGVAFDVADVAARAPAIDIERVEHRWIGRGERDLTGDPLAIARRRIRDAYANRGNLRHLPIDRSFEEAS